MRVVLVVLVACAAIALLPRSASAASPDIAVFKVDESFFYEEGSLCPFIVEVREIGKLRIATFFDKAGGVRQASQNPSLVDVLTNPSNGKTLTSADRGLDKTVFNADGTIAYLSTGVHIKINGVFYSIGTYKIVFGPEGFISFEQHGANLGGDASAAICPLLA